MHRQCMVVWGYSLDLSPEKARRPVWRLDAGTGMEEYVVGLGSERFGPNDVPRYDQFALWLHQSVYGMGPQLHD